MLAKDLISTEIPALRTSDTGLDALNWMEVFRISHLPIVNNEEFLGLVSDSDIYDLNAPEYPLGNHNLSLSRPYVRNNQHIYEVIEVFSRLKLTVVPVLDYDNNYCGLIRVSELMQYFSKLTAVEKTGSIIILEINQSDYSLTEIAQIIESNDAKILSLYLKSQTDTLKINITIKNITPVGNIK
ncbi:MAG: CBS domain-containing protein [Bacteroidota bacterium]|nr:CBS domain-containing protein [Bacteroidota bacterium]